MRDKIKVLVAVIKGNAIVINEEQSGTKIYVGANNDTQNIKRIASEFFKLAYKLN